MIRENGRLSQERTLAQNALDYIAVLAIFGFILPMAGCGGSANQFHTVPPEPTPALSLAEATHHLDVLAREPMVVEHPDGTLFVTGYGSSSPVLWSSEDGGASWHRVNIGTKADGAVGNSDVDLVIGPDGTVYLIVMSYDREIGEGTGIVVGAGLNGGSDWSWTSLSQERYDDRPWIGAAPDGTLHAIWNDGRGVSYVVSTDRGRTWEERPRIHGTGGSSHLAIGPSGEVAVRITPMSASGNQMDENTDFIAVSSDSGNSWHLHVPPGKREWTFPLDDIAGVPRWVEPLAWDGAGALYYLWSEGTSIWLGRSLDRGNTWSTWQIVQGQEVVYFPYLAASRAGELAATWFSGRGVELRANVALITPDSTDSHPRVTRAKPFQFDSYRRSGDKKLVRDTAGEYLPVVFLSDGRLAVVTTIQDLENERQGFTWWPHGH
jgi:hypothetical protein